MTSTQFAADLASDEALIATARYTVTQVAKRGSKTLGTYPDQTFAQVGRWHVTTVNSTRIRLVITRTA